MHIISDGQFACGKALGCQHQNSNQSAMFINTSSRTVTLKNFLVVEKEVVEEREVLDLICVDFVIDKCVCVGRQLFLR